MKLGVGQHSDKGRKAVNQDFHGACIPQGAALATKGVVLALADGISSSEVSQVASEAAVRSFIDDYYATSQAWSVRRSAQRVMAASNSWLHAQTLRSAYRHDKDQGYVCTLSVLVLRSATAHLFHVGDSRIYRLAGEALEPLTEDHRVGSSPGHNHLSRALGFNEHLEIDYLALPLAAGDVFVMATDGVYEHTDGPFIAAVLREHAGDLDAAARAIVAEALRRGSGDNLTVQIARIDSLAGPEASEVPEQRTRLQLPPLLETGATFDGYTIVRELHASGRSHVYLAEDPASGQRVVLKMPSIDLQGDTAYLDRLLMEEWVARRLDSPHVLKPAASNRRRDHLYVAMEFVEGQTLAQWMLDHPRPELETVRGIVEQIARGLQAFHRMEMLHQDLRPANVMIDRHGSVKIIDFGATYVAGLENDAARGLGDAADIRGTAQYTAPEYFIGEAGSQQSDQFSLGVIAYQMLSGRLPYGTRVAGAHTRAAQRRLMYDSVLDERRAIPAWIDAVLKRAVDPSPHKRYEALSEFVQDLRRPNAAFLSRSRPPLIERNPLRFWKGLSLLLALAVLVLLAVLRLA